MVANNTRMQIIQSDCKIITEIPALALGSMGALGKAGGKLCIAPQNTWPIEKVATLTEENSVLRDKMTNDGGRGVSRHSQPAA